MKIYTKLAAIQSKIGKLSKDMENPYYKSKYFDVNKLLEQLMPLLQEQGLLILQPIKDNRVETIIINLESPEEQVKSSIWLGEITDPQKIGSAITYYRRYGLQSLLGLQAEDDDGNKASGLGEPKKPKETLKESTKKWLNIMDNNKKVTPQWSNLLIAIANGKINNVQQVRDVYKVSNDVAAEIERQIQLINS